MKAKLILLVSIITVFFIGCSQKKQVPSQVINLQSNSSSNKNASENIIETENDLAEFLSQEKYDNKLFKGKWKSEEFTINGSDLIIFLNIDFENEKTKLSYNFNTTAFYSSPVYFEDRYDSLYFCHNDEDHRAEYVLNLESSDLIKCKFSIKNCFGFDGIFEKDIKFTRLSNEDEIKYNLRTVEPEDLSRIEILREYAEYGTDTYDVKFEYKFDERENMLDIIEKNNLDESVRGKSDVETAIFLMNWLCVFLLN